MRLVIGFLIGAAVFFPLLALFEWDARRWAERERDPGVTGNGADIAASAAGRSHWGHVHADAEATDPALASSRSPSADREAA